MPDLRLVGPARERKIPGQNGTKQGLRLTVARAETPCNGETCGERPQVSRGPAEDAVQRRDLSYNPRMSRLRRIESAGRAFFVTTHFSKVSLPVCEAERDTVLSSIAMARSRRGFLLAAYVVMPTHCHMLFVPAAGDTFAAVMREIKLRAAKRILAGRSRSGAFWQARSFDRIMRNWKEWVETLEYIHWNPVKDGLVKDPGDWAWSSWGAYVPGGEPPIPVDRIELPADENARLVF